MRRRMIQRNFVLQKWVSEREKYSEVASFRIFAMFKSTFLAAALVLASVVATAFAAPNAEARQTVYHCGLPGVAQKLVVGRAVDRFYKMWAELVVNLAQARFVPS
ncbi:hypothetical protein FPV67DRAFT_1486185, partial [Lyophyllum atratum]